MQGSIGLNYYVARFYDPQLARFAQADSLVPEPGKSVSFDRYVYVKNNPIKYTDPTGHKWTCTGANNDHCYDDGNFDYRGGDGGLSGMAKNKSNVFFDQFSWQRFEYLFHPHTKAIASNVQDLLRLGIAHEPSAIIVGEGLQSIRDDPNVKKNREELIKDIRSDPRYKKAPYYLNVSPIKQIHANGPDGNWLNGLINGNQAVCMVHTANMNAINTDVYSDGSIHTTFNINDIFDYLPDWFGRSDQLPDKAFNYFAYNISATWITMIYHVWLMAPPYQTTAQWNEVIPPD